MLTCLREGNRGITERRFLGGPVPWLVGLLWADFGVLTGLAVCVSQGRFAAIRLNPSASFAIFAIFVVVGLTISIAISNRQNAERRALKRPIANACIGLYAVSLEVQGFISTLQFVSHNDVNGRIADLAALREAAASIERAANALAPSSVLDPVDVERVLQTGKNVIADAHQCFATACQALDRTAYDHRERWAAARQLANDALVKVGKAIEVLQQRR